VHEADEVAWEMAMKAARYWSAASLRSRSHPRSCSSGCSRSTSSSPRTREGEPPDDAA